MNKAQFRTVRKQLGFTEIEMGKALGYKYSTIRYLETGIELTAPGELCNKRAKLDHIMSFACAWMLLNGGPLIPWDRSEDANRFRSFREHHGMTNEEIAALFVVSMRQAEYFTSPQGGVFVAPRHLMAMCWMRIFGCKDPFNSMMHNQYTKDSATFPAFNLKPMNTNMDDRFRVVIDA